MIRQTWRCRYCPCLSYTSELSVIHELHECYKNPRNLIKTEYYFMKKKDKLSSTTTPRPSTPR